MITNLPIVIFGLVIMSLFVGFLFNLVFERDKKKCVGALLIIALAILVSGPTYAYLGIRDLESEIESKILKAKCFHTENVLIPGRTYMILGEPFPLKEVPALFPGAVNHILFIYDQYDEEDLVKKFTLGEVPKWKCFTPRDDGVFLESNSSGIEALANAQKPQEEE